MFFGTWNNCFIDETIVPTTKKLFQHKKKCSTMYDGLNASRPTPNICPYMEETKKFWSGSNQLSLQIPFKKKNFPYI